MSSYDIYSLALCRCINKSQKSFLFFYYTFIYKILGDKSDIIYINISLINYCNISFVVVFINIFHSFFLFIKNKKNKAFLLFVLLKIQRYQFLYVRLAYHIVRQLGPGPLELEMWSFQGTLIFSNLFHMITNHFIIILN